MVFSFEYTVLDLSGNQAMKAKNRLIGHFLTHNELQKNRQKMSEST